MQCQLLNKYNNGILTCLFKMCDCRPSCINSVPVLYLSLPIILISNSKVSKMQ